MALILSIETSGVHCSVALHRDGALVNMLNVNEPQAHASRLGPLIHDVFQRSSLQLKSLGAVAISAGPGSYTGLRIGTSTVKGICFSLDIPLIAVTTLDLLAYEGRRTFALDDGLLCPMIDARRMEVYCQVMTKDLKQVTPMEAKIIDESAFSELLSHSKVFFFGDGAAKCREVLKHPNSFFPEGIYPSVDALGILANEKFIKNSVEDLRAFTPVYLKEFIAKKAQPFF